jgi:hypothetical protein
LEHESLPYGTYRTYHPNYPQRNRRDIIERIKNITQDNIILISNRVYIKKTIKDAEEKVMYEKNWPEEFSYLIPVDYSKLKFLMDQTLNRIGQEYEPFLGDRYNKINRNRDARLKETKKYYNDFAYIKDNKVPDFTISVGFILNSDYSNKGEKIKTDIILPQIYASIEMQRKHDKYDKFKKAFISYIGKSSALNRKWELVCYEHGWGGGPGDGMLAKNQIPIIKDSIFPIDWWREALDELRQFLENNNLL